MAATLRSRLAVQYTIVSAVILFILWAASFAILYRFSIYQIDELLRQECEEFIYTLSFSDNNVRIIHTDEWDEPEHMPGSKHPVYVEIVSPEHDIMLSTKNSYELSRPAWTHRKDGYYVSYSHGERIRYYVQTIEKEGDILGRVMVAVTYHDLYAMMRIFFAVAIPVFLLGTLFNFAGGLLIAKRSLYPFKLITRQIRQLESANLKDRIHPDVEDREIKSLVDEINDFLNRMETSYKSVKQFSADASHELKTPISIMLTEIESALKNPRLKEPQTVLHSLKNELRHLQDIIDILTGMALIESDTYMIANEQVWLNDIIHREVRLFENFAKKQGITFDTENIQSVCCKGDEKWLSVLIRNILDNAVKYGKSGKLVKISLFRQGMDVTISIRDFGPGVPEESLPHLTNRFFRVEKYRSHARGTGLGLSICHWIAEKHNGHLTIRNAEPGLEVMVTLTACG